MLFHIISDRYISYLQKSEPNVMSNKEGVRTYHRKYLGVLTELNGFRYFIPLSSPKESKQRRKIYTTKNLPKKKTSRQRTATCF